MKVVLLAGGLGTRLREETEFRPKPMVEIGGRPILWHIMKIYAAAGYNDFVICLGYKGDVIRDYFLNYEVRNRDFTITLGCGRVDIHDDHAESGWRITLAETGDNTLTGGRIKRVANYLEGQTFMATYGDGVADIDIRCLLEFHRRHRKLATVTAVRPSSRYGELAIRDGSVTLFREKPQVHEGWINGGFFVFEPDVLKLIESDMETLEQGLLSELASRQELGVYQHDGFWQCMDTYREAQSLERDMVKRQRSLGDMESEIARSFWRGRSVLLTGHTGFKGGWLATWLLELGARVTGYSLPPDPELSYFSRCRLDRHVNSVLADIRDLNTLKQTIAGVQPEIVFHLAAQPLVRHSYIEPSATFETNVMGTVNLLEAMRTAPSVKAAVIVTSDKCYQNREWAWGYREDDILGGRDPYSASKACAEIVTDAYRKSFLGLNGRRVAVATARAGNVIGGGDWAADRLLPDAVRALRRNVPLVLRNPDSVRPWQHVLEPLAGYIMLAQKLYYDGERYSGAFNFASDEEDAIPVAKLAEIAIRHWGVGSWQTATGGEANSPLRETGYLRLDSGKARQVLGWRPRLSLEQAVKMTIDWYREALHRPQSDMYDLSRCQLRAYEHAVPHRNAKRSGQPTPA